MLDCDELALNLLRRWEDSGHLPSFDQLRQQSHSQLQRLVAWDEGVA